MLLKFKITEQFQLNDWTHSNLNKMKWDITPYDPLDNQNKFYFFRYVSIDNSNTDEPRYFPVFLRNYNFYEQTMDLYQYILDHKDLFVNKKLIPVILDPMEGFDETTNVVIDLANKLKGICDVYLINGNNLLTKSENNFKFYITNHWIHHLKDTPTMPSKLNENHKIFISLNRMAREHRVILTSKIIKNNLRQYGYITWANGRSHRYKDYTDDYPEVINEKYDVLDVVDILQENPTKTIPQKYCNDSFLFLVTETHFNNRTIFFSEKTFKPILVEMPFMVLGNPNTLQILKEMGFKTFDRWFNEDYDLDLPLEKRCDIIVSEISRLSKMSNTERLAIRREMSDILKHNHSVLQNLMKRSDLVESLMDIGKQIYTDRK